MKFFIFLIAYSVILTGCATSYQKTGFSGGFSNIQLGENIFQVTFKGNAYTSRERAANFSLLRSAEISLENGFRYFVIVDAEKYMKTSSYTTPITSDTTSSAYMIGNHVYGDATTTTSGGQTYFYSKPRSSNTIIGFRKKPNIDALVYDAVFVSKSLRKKYKIKN